MKMSKLIVNGCPKNMLNGPCGGGSGGYCEVDNRICPWVKMFKNSKSEIPKVFSEVILDQGFTVKDYLPQKREPVSKLMRKIVYGKRVLTYEVETGRGKGFDALASLVKELKEYIDAFNFTDNPAGVIESNPLPLAYAIMKELDVEVIPQLTCKDRNRAALTSYVLSLIVLGIRNIVVATGDWPHIGSPKSVKPVFDLDSVRLVYLIRLISDLGVDFSGRPLGTKGKIVHVGVVANLHFDPLDLEVLKLKKKVKAGAEFTQTQPVYSYSQARTFLNKLKEYKVEIPVILTLTPLSNSGIIRLLEEKLKIPLPDEYKEKLKQCKSKEEVLNYNIEYFTKLIDELSSLNINGFHIITLGNVTLAKELAKHAKQ